MIWLKDYHGVVNFAFAFQKQEGDLYSAQLFTINNIK
jgi:hypothetical protein